MLPFCKMKANRRNIPNSLVRRRLRVRPIQTRQEKPWPRTAPSKTPTPTTPAGKSWRDTGGQMPNTTWTRRAEAARGQPKPQHRENTQQNGTKHMGRAEAATQRNHTQNKAKHAGRAKAPTHGKYTQNRKKNTGQAEAPTQGNHTTERDTTHGASRSPNTEANTRGEPKPQPRKGQQKTQNTNHTEEQKPPNQKGRRRKENKSKTKETKRKKTRKAKESTGTKKGEKKRRRADRPAQGRRENESMVAWANHRNGTGKPKNPINCNLQTGPSQSPSSGRHSNISNPVRERGHCHTCAEFGEEGKEVPIGSQPLVPPPGSS